MTIESVKRLAESRYYSGVCQPQTLGGVTDFIRDVGVNPLSNVVETHWKKLQRRQATAVSGSGQPNASVVPFSDLFAIIVNCYFENAKVDPLLAEDQECFVEAWTLCGGRPDCVGTVSAAALAAVLADLGISEEIISRHVTEPMVPRRSSSDAGSADLLTYKEFIEMATPALTVGSVESESKSGRAPALYTHEEEDAYSRPRLSLRMMMRVKRVVRAFRRRRQRKIDQERREKELDAYSRKYFGVALLGGNAEPEHASSDQPPVVSSGKSFRIMTSTASSANLRREASVGPERKPSQNLIVSKVAAKESFRENATTQQAVGGALAAVRAVRSAGLPPLIDESQSAFDRALQQHERASRRAAKERHSERLRRLLRSHPHSGDLDVVQANATSPVKAPVLQRIEERARSPEKFSTFGRPRPKPLSPTQLRQRRP